MLRHTRSRPWKLAPVALLSLAACGGRPAPEPPAAEPSVTTLGHGAHFRGTNGIMFGPDGLLWVASVATPALAAIDPDSGKIEQEWGADVGVKGPDDLAFGPDGSVYWTDISYGEVGRRTPDGTTSVVASLGPGVNPITFSDDGRLFVSQCFMGDKLFEIDPAGVEKPRLISDQLGPSCGFNGMDWGPDGKLYGPRWFQGAVSRIDVDTGRLETVADGFGVPAALKFDSHGRLHVLDSLRGEVVRIDTVSGAREVVGRVPPSTADNLAFSATDRLFVSSFGDGFILEVLDPGHNRTVVPGGINMPGGLALVSRSDGAPGDARDVLYLADFFALRGLDPTTGDETYVAHDIIGFSEVGNAMTVAADGDHLVTSSWFENTVKVWDPGADAVVVSFTGLGRPIDAVPFQGDLVVSEWDTGSVVRLRAEQPESRTAIATGIATPAGLAALGDDLYVADRNSGRVLQIVNGGTVEAPPREVANGLQGPEGIALDGEGHLYVVEAEGGRVSRVDLGTGQATPVAEGLALNVPAQGDYPTTMLFNGIALGPGAIYVTGDLENVIYRIAR